MGPPGVRAGAFHRKFCRGGRPGLRRSAAAIAGRRRRSAQRRRALPRRRAVRTRGHRERPARCRGERQPHPASRDPRAVRARLSAALGALPVRHGRQGPGAQRPRSLSVAAPGRLCRAFGVRDRRGPRRRGRRFPRTRAQFLPGWQHRCRKLPVARRRRRNEGLHGNLSPEPAEWRRSGVACRSRRHARGWVPPPPSMARSSSAARWTEL